MRASRAVLLEILRLQLWVVPTIAALLAAAFAAVLVWVDDATGSLGLPLSIDAASARAVLSAISGAMISFTALVFTVTMLVLQTAATQLSPRVTRTFLRDRFNQSVLGLFVATFVFSLLVLVTVSDSHVPALAVVAAVGFVLVAILAFVAYLDHMAHDIRPTSVIDSIASETRAVVAETYPETVDGGQQGPSQQSPSMPPGGQVVTWSGASGYVQGFDRDGLERFAQRAGTPLELTVGTGDFLVHGRPLLSLPHGAGATVAAAADELESCVRVGAERTMAADPEFGFRQLVDVALRALSPSLNDPSTAIQVVDRLDELLVELTGRNIPAPLVLTAKSGPVAIVPAPDWDAFVDLATSEIGHACRGMPQVRLHLRGVVETHLREAPSARQPALRRALAALESEQARDDDPPA